MLQTTQSICSILRCIKDVKWICAITNRNENCNITAAYNANSIRIVMPKNFNCNHQRPRWPENYFYIKMIKANTPWLQYWIDSIFLRFCIRRFFFINYKIMLYSFSRFKTKTIRVDLKTRSVNLQEQIKNIHFDYSSLFDAMLTLSIVQTFLVFLESCRVWLSWWRLVHK